MGQMQLFQGTARKIVRGDQSTEFFYHRTAVVTVYWNRIVLNSGGWRTATTKTAMNQASRQYRLGFTVHQRKGDWFVSHDGQELPFEDGMELPY